MAYGLRTSFGPRRVHTLMSSTATPSRATPFWIDHHLSTRGPTRLRNPCVLNYLRNRCGLSPEPVYGIWAAHFFRATASEDPNEQHSNALQDDVFG